MLEPVEKIGHGCEGFGSVRGGHGENERSLTDRNLAAAVQGDDGGEAVALGRGGGECVEFALGHGVVGLVVEGSDVAVGRGVARVGLGAADNALEAKGCASGAGMSEGGEVGSVRGERGRFGGGGERPIDDEGDDVHPPPTREMRASSSVGRMGESGAAKAWLMASRAPDVAKARWGC